MAAQAMKRREFITVVGGAAAWPLLAMAQQQAGRVYKIARFTAGKPTPAHLRSVFQDALGKLGWIVGENIFIEDRYGEDRLDRLPDLAADLVRLNVDVIVAAGTLAPLAAKRATSTIPIVMSSAGDPAASGLVASLAQPGGNITGLSLMAPELGGKRLEILKELLPNLSRVAVLWNAANPYSALVFRETETASQKLGIGIQSLEVRAPGDFDGALAAALAKHAQALVAVEDPRTFGHRQQIIESSDMNRLPAIYGVREFVDDGGFLSYGANLEDMWRRAAGYVDKILKGAKPSDLPVEQPTKFEVVVNLKTAKALGLTIPPSLLARADELIE